MKQHAVMGGPQPAVLQEVSCGPAGQFKLAWFAGPGSGLSLNAHTPRDKNRAAAHETRDRARTPGGELQSICSETALPAPSSAVFSRRADTAGHRAQYHVPNYASSLAWHELTVPGQQAGARGQGNLSKSPFDGS